MSDIISIIQSLGFPIACVVALFLMWQQEVKAHDVEMEKMRDQMAAQQNDTIEALNNNTVMLQKILTRLGEDEQP
jgi:uncharacterized membrane protein (DUF106 family)